MVKVKICGITNIEDAGFAAKLGTWAIGFIFYEKSPRYISPIKAKEISKEMKKNGIKTIGVFVNENPNKINQIIQTAQLDYVQMHGVESVSNCNKLTVPYIKNIRNINEINKYNNAFAYLVDATDTEQWGGTGKLADWDLAKEIKAQGKTLMLSGGLSLNNIEEAIESVNPDYSELKRNCCVLSPLGERAGVRVSRACQCIDNLLYIDISSNLEITPGKKDHKKMSDFFEKIKTIKEINK